MTMLHELNKCATDRFFKNWWRRGYTCSLVIVWHRGVGGHAPLGKKIEICIANGAFWINLYHQLRDKWRSHNLQNLINGSSYDQSLYGQHLTWKARYDYTGTREVIFGHLDLQSNKLLVSFFVHYPVSGLCPPRILFKLGMNVLQSNQCPHWKFC